MAKRGTWTDSEEWIEAVLAMFPHITVFEKLKKDGGVLITLLSSKGIKREVLDEFERFDFAE